MLGMLLCAPLLVAGCGGAGSPQQETGPARPGGVVQVNQLGDAHTLNPSEMIDTASIDVSTQINETLFRLGEGGETVPLLAKSATRSGDGLTWTIRLRNGVKFSNGQPMTAKDVVFSLDAARRSAYYESLWAEVVAVKAISPLIVRITTKNPVPALVSDLMHYSAAVVPENFGGVSAEEFAQHPIGTGPYVLKSWQHGQSITLVRNPHYWQAGEPLANEVIFNVSPEDNASLEQLRGGDTDLVPSPAWSQIEGLESNPDLRVRDYGLYAVDFISLNLNTPVFKDPKVRQALNLALDRKGIVQAALGGRGRVAASFLPPAVPGSDQSIRPPARNLDKARRLLGEASKAGVDPSFTLITTAGQAYATAASQIIQQNLDEAGFNVKLQALDESAAIEEWFAGESEAVLNYMYSAVPDPSELSSFYIEDIAAISGSKMPPLEQLSSQGSAELNPARRTDLYNQLQEKVADELQLVAIDYEPAVWAMKADLAGLEVSPLGTPWLNTVGFSG